MFSPVGTVQPNTSDTLSEVSPTAEATIACGTAVRMILLFILRVLPENVISAIQESLPRR